MYLFNVNNLDFFLRIFIALVLGVILGLERIAAKKMAGMRTYGLVSMGSALFVVISEIIIEKYRLVGALDLEPLRMASQIIVGIGFLGAGLIIFKESRLKGLTTAAGLWVSSGIGIACGFALYDIAIFVTVLTFVVFSLLWLIEKEWRKFLGHKKSEI